jgi:hypothetical protein
MIGLTFSLKETEAADSCPAFSCASTPGSKIATPRTPLNVAIQAPPLDPDAIPQPHEKNLRLAPCSHVVAAPSGHKIQLYRQPEKPESGERASGKPNNKGPKMPMKAWSRLIFIST